MVINKKKGLSKSATFLLPMLGINLTLFNNFYNVYYKTVYNEDENKKRIYVVYESDKITDETTENISKCFHYINSFLVDGFKVFVYRVPPPYIEDFTSFTVGNYNKFTKSYKQVLLISYNTQKDKINKIINTTEENRKDKALSLAVSTEDINEVFPIADEIEETFSISDNYKLEL